MINKPQRRAQLCVAATTTAVFAGYACGYSSASQTHILKHGETIDALAHRYHVGVKAILSLNHVSSVHALRGARKVLVPSAPKLTRIPATMHKGAGLKVDNVRMRGGPGLEHPRLCVLDSDATFVVTAHRDGWSQVKLDSGQSGWIRSRYIRALHEPHASVAKNVRRRKHGETTSLSASAIGKRKRTVHAAAGLSQRLAHKQHEEARAREAAERASRHHERALAARQKQHANEIAEARRLHLQHVAAAQHQHRLEALAQTRHKQHIDEIAAARHRRHLEEASAAHYRKHLVTTAADHHSHAGDAAAKRREAAHHEAAIANARRREQARHEAALAARNHERAHHEAALANAKRRAEQHHAAAVANARHREKLRREAAAAAHRRAEAHHLAALENARHRAELHRRREIAASHEVDRSFHHHFRPEAESPTPSSDVVRAAYAYRGTPYRWGMSRPGGFDCSGFTKYVYGRKGVSLPRTAAEQFHAGKPVGDSGMKPGDLVFFHTTRSGISHVGMYVGSNKFIHSSSKKSGGVRVDNLNGYYSKAFRGARRFQDEQSESSGE